MVVLALALGLGACGVEGDDDNPICDSDADGYDGAQCDGEDCDDTEPTYNPGVTERCNGVDDDCNPATTETADLDGDGYSVCDGDCDDADATVPVPPGYDGDGDGFCASEGATCSDGSALGDCNDCDPAVNPNVNEIPGDGQDNDCDGVVDETN
jgi:hypothetical protein